MRAAAAAGTAAAKCSPARAQPAARCRSSRTMRDGRCAPRLGQLFSRWRQLASPAHLRACTSCTQRHSQATSDVPTPMLPPAGAAPHAAPSPPPPSASRYRRAHRWACPAAPLPPAPPPPPPAPAASPPPPFPTQQQGGEQMQCERAKNARRRSPAVSLLWPVQLCILGMSNLWLCSRPAVVGRVVLRHTQLVLCGVRVCVL